MTQVIQFTRLIDSATRHHYLPQVFPDLPYRNSPWPANVLAAYDKLSEIYRHALRISRQEDVDPLQLIFHLSAIDDDALPVLQAIQDDPIGMDLRQWLLDMTELFGHTFSTLSSYHQTVQNK